MNMTFPFSCYLWIISKMVVIPEEFMGSNQVNLLKIINNRAASGMEHLFLKVCTVWVV